nr:MarR family transcriptional regulator [Microbacterium sp. XT11]
MDDYTPSGYWYPDTEAASTVDVLNQLRRYRAAETAMRARTRALMGMNETDLMALRYLLREHRAGRLVRQIDIARVLDISTASTTALIDRLERGGHVRREPHPTDRRAGIVVPTTHSDEEVRTTLGAMHRRMLALVDRLSDEDRAVITRFLAGMTAAIEEASENDDAEHDAAAHETDRAHDTDEAGTIRE